MPNYCSNSLTVHLHDPQALAALVESLEGDEEALSFRSVIAAPEAGGSEEAESAEEKLQRAVGPGSRFDLWGSSSDAYDVERVQLNPCAVRFTFTTSWSPPVPVAEALSAKVPDGVVHLAWLEEGNALMGAVYLSDGREVLTNEADPSDHLRCPSHSMPEECSEECWDYAELELPAWWHYEDDLAKEFSKS
jgi:hypothetical protein